MAVSPATTWAFVTTRPRPDHEARSLLLVAAGGAEDLDRRQVRRRGQGPGGRARRRGDGSRQGRGQGGEDLGEALLVEVVLQVREHRGHLGEHTIDRVEDVGAGHRGAEPREAAVRRGDHAGHEPRGEQHRDHRHSHPECGIDRAEVEAAERRIAVAPKGAAEDRQGSRGDEDGGDRDARTFVGMVDERQRAHPHHGPEQQPQPEAGEGQKLDEGAEPEPVDRGQQHQHDDQHIDPIHGSEGSQRCTEILRTRRYSRCEVPSTPLRRFRRARRPGGRHRVAVLVTLGLTAAACTTTTPPSKGPREPRVLGQQTGAPAVVGQPAPAGSGQLDAVTCAGPTHCWAVGAPGPTGATASTPSSPPSPATVIDATVDGGVTWAAQPVALTPAPVLTAISCPGQRLCMAVGLSETGTAGVVLTTANGGIHLGPGLRPRRCHRGHRCRVRRRRRLHRHRQ